MASATSTAFSSLTPAQLSGASTKLLGWQQALSTGEVIHPLDSVDLEQWSSTSRPQRWACL